MYHVPCIYGCSDGGKNGDGEEGSEISGGGKRGEIAWLFVCQRLVFVLQVGGRPEGNGGTFC